MIHLDDIRKLLECCKGRSFYDRRDNAFIRVLFDTGCRRGELVNLTLDDWDRRQDFLTLRGKTGTRVVPVSASTGEALARYVRARRNHEAAAKTDALWLEQEGRLARLGREPDPRQALRSSRAAPHQPPPRSPPAPVPRRSAVTLCSPLSGSTWRTVVGITIRPER